MITREQLNSITCLNKTFQNNEYYRAAVSIDYGIRNHTNVYKCIKIMELYNYLYKHFEMLKNIFSANDDGNFSDYTAQRTIMDMHRFMCEQDASAAQAVEELKRIRKATDYKADELRNKLNNQKPNMLKQAYEKACIINDTSNPSNEQVRQEAYAVINSWIDRIAKGLMCRKYKDPNTKAILLTRQASGLASDSTIAVINIIETPNNIEAVLVKSGTSEIFYIREETVNEIIANLRGGRAL